MEAGYPGALVLARIVVGVHSVRSGESLAFGDISVHSSDRMDNLLRVHS
jgi:hypothetical protein